MLQLAERVVCMGECKRSCVVTVFSVSNNTCFHYHFIHSNNHFIDNYEVLSPRKVLGSPSNNDFSILG